MQEKKETRGTASQSTNCSIVVYSLVIVGERKKERKKEEMGQPSKVRRIAVVGFRSVGASFYLYKYLFK
jgi:hypothetical protein